jgi:sucrose-6-phosphate hydrolase SacC (GH32 family)
MKCSFLIFAFVASFLISTAAKPVKPFDEIYRPQFHFTPEKNWLSNPAGLVYYKGEYHLFYQHNPFSNKRGYIHWGHAVSTDLIHWEHLPVALDPDNNSKDSIDCTVFSGSGWVDENNVTGLQSGDEKTILLFYTGYRCGQRIAYSNDKGRTWKKYEKNPIIPYAPTDDARNPKVFWYEPGKHYVMALYRKPENRELAKGISFYTSNDLINWTFKSHIPGFSECPDLVELSLGRREDEKKWVIFDADGSYVVGSFNGESFKPETPKIKSAFGPNFYAAQTWSNIPETDKRTIQIAWMHEGEFPGMPFDGQMSFPCELDLKKFPDGMHLVRKPIKEIEKLHLKGDLWENKNLIPGMNKNLVKGVKGDCLHIIGDFSIKTVNSFGFGLRLDKANNGIELVYDAKEKTLSCMGYLVSLEPGDGNIKLEILLDRSSLEIFANDGKAVMSLRITPSENANGLYLFNTGGELLVNKLEIYPLNSIWNTGK